jgi:tetratricopeptide (TPR) repeat protein
MTASLAVAGGMSLNKAEELYKRTDYENSLALLDANSSDPEVLFLAGRNHYMMGEFKKATDYMQKAIAARPNSSEYYDWLGRVYGKRAETGNPLTAPAYASKARDAFEKSVQLDGKNSEALSDLFDYYLEAPGFLGGGYDKAYAVAQKIAAVDPPEGYFTRRNWLRSEKSFKQPRRGCGKR